MITTPDPAMSGQMKLVPVEATPEMIRVGFVLALGTDDEQPSIAEVWRAMVEAAPELGEGLRERIVRAAVTYKGAVYSVEPPGRHHNCLQLASLKGMPVGGEDDQGFLTSTGRFIGRIGAWEIAKEAGQLLPRAPTDGRGGELYSEDVW